MEYNAADRLSMWQEGRDAKTILQAAALGTREMKECTFTPNTTTTPSKTRNAGKHQPSPSQSKHFARLQNARKKALDKKNVPHATGKKWTGKTTVAKAPQLSCYRRSNSNNKNTEGYASSVSVSISNSTSSSLNVQKRKERLQKENSMRKGIRSNKKVSTKRGSFSSPRMVEKNCSRAMIGSSYSTIHKEGDVATEYVPPNKTGSSGLADELIRLRQQLHVEEALHLHLTKNNQPSAPSAPMAAPFAAPTEPFAPSAPFRVGVAFTPIAPPAPPLGPPPSQRSGKQSPQPNDMLQQQQQQQQQQHEELFAATCVPVPYEEYENENENENENQFHTQNQMHNEYRTGLGDTTALVLRSQNQNTNQNQTKNKNKNKFNWKTIKKTLILSQKNDIQKRLSMEDRLRALESNNLKILGISNEQLKEICGKDRKILSPAPIHRNKGRTISTQKSNSKHIKRMGKAMQKKVKHKMNQPSYTKGTKTTTGRSTTMSNRGGALSRSSRGL